MDNRFVVPHNVDLIVKYQAHINVEICNQTKVVKYLFKYINKGPNRVRVVLQSIQEPGGTNADQTTQAIDEIKQYLDCRYLAAHETCWRLFDFSIHYRELLVQHLLIHLLRLYNFYFSDHDALTDVLTRPDVHKTMFTE